MRFRKLRIAWSVLCAIACVLLVVLWVRSYFWVNGVMKVSGTQQWGVHSGEGSLTIRWHYEFVDSNDGWIFQNTSKARLDTVEEEFRAAGGKTIVYTRKLGLTGDGAFTSTYWLCVLIAGTVAAIPWVKWRFTLRTLLLATTLVAVVLGLIVWRR